MFTRFDLRMLYAGLESSVRQLTHKASNRMVASRRKMKLVCYQCSVERVPTRQTERGRRVLPYLATGISAGSIFHGRANTATIITAPELM